MGQNKNFLPEDHTYRPHAIATAGGSRLPVTSFKLQLTAAGIPRLVIRVDPFHKLDDPVDVAQAPGLSTFIDRWSAFQELILSADNRNIDFEFRGYGSKDKKQNISLSKWIILSAGFSDVRASGGFAFVIEAVHPMYEFQESTAHLLGSAVEGKLPVGAVTGENVLAALISGAEAYLEKHSDDNISSEVNKDKCYISVIDDYKNMVKILKERLKWGTGSDQGFPDGGLSADVFKRIPYGVVEYAKSLNNAGSWDWLVRTFCAHWLLTIIPTYWSDKLIMAPLEPWQKHKMLIYDTDMVSVNLPAVDPTPIRGIVGLFSPSILNSAEYSGYRDGNSKILREAISTVIKDMKGRTLMLGMPGWINSMLVDNAVSASEYCAPTPKNINEILSYGMSNNADDFKGGGSIDSEDLDAVMEPDNGILKLLSRELFLENYKMHYQISMRCRLMIKSDNATTPDNYIVPGYVLRIQADPDLAGSEGKPLVDFYVTKVVHHVDCANRSASTEIGGSFVHASDTPTLTDLSGNVVIDKGIAKNAMYSGN